ncbi:MAG: hypothetical protein ACN4GZ_14965 [Acidimicrobiales bacterium]
MNTQSGHLRRLPPRPGEPLSNVSRLALGAHLRLRAMPPRRILAVLLGLFVGVSTWALLHSARADSASWGERVEVLVASADLPAGAELDRTNSELVPFPIALLPKGAVTDFEVGRFVSHPVSLGQVIVSGQSGLDRHGLIAGTRAITLPEPLAPPALEVGDRVDLIAVQAGVDGAVTTTIGSAAVSELGDEEITVVVDRMLVPLIFESLGSGSVEFARRPTKG